MATPTERAMNEADELREERDRILHARPESFNTREPWRGVRLHHIESRLGELRIERGEEGDDR